MIKQSLLGQLAGPAGVRAAHHECGATPLWSALELHLPAIAAGAGPAPWHPAYDASDPGQGAAQAAAAGAALDVAMLLALLAPDDAPLLSITLHQLQGNRKIASTSSPLIGQRSGETWKCKMTCQPCWLQAMHGHTWASCHVRAKQCNQRSMYFLATSLKQLCTYSGQSCLLGFSGASSPSQLVYVSGKSSLPRSGQVHHENWQCYQSTSKAQLEVLLNLIVRSCLSCCTA